MEKLLTQLKLARIREVYQDWIDKASKEEMSYADFLRGLLSEETCAREESRIRRRMRQAGFPFEKTIEQFDFSLRPELKRQVVLNCMDETFVHQGRSMVLIGPPGTGKTQPRKCISRIDSFYWRVCNYHRSTASAVWTNLVFSSYH
jgi:DNA replication protein DnaC